LTARFSSLKTGPLVAFYNRMAALVFSVWQSTVVCNEIPGGGTFLIRRMFLSKKSKF